MLYVVCSSLFVVDCLFLLLFVDALVRCSALFVLRCLRLLLFVVCCWCLLAFVGVVVVLVCVSGCCL